MPYVSNQIKPRIDNVTGAEIVTRTRMKFTARNPEQVQGASALTDLILFLQEKNNSSSLWSQTMLKARIGGLSFHHLLPIQDTIREEVLNSLEVIWDPMDRTKDFSDSRGMGFVKWYTKEQLALKYPDKKDEIESAALTDDRSIGFSAPLGGVWGQRMNFANTGYIDRHEGKVMVVVFYYRVPKKFYTYVNKNKQIAQTFWKQEAEKNKQRGEEVSVNEGYQIRQCVFTGNILFDEGEYPYQLDYYKGLFPMTPVCLNREENTGMPFGLVRAAIDDQRMYNRTVMKIDWIRRSRQVLMDQDAVEDVQVVQDEIARPDAIIVKAANKEFQILKNLDELQTHYSMLPIHIQAIERNLGIFDEAVGAQTNASSGKAIQLRKSGSQTTQAMFLDTLRSAKREAGRKMALMAQMKFDDRMMFSITGDDGKVQQKFINAPKTGPDGKPEKDPDGNVVREADITSLDFNVFLDEAPDTATVNEDARQRLQEMITSGVNVQALTPGMLKTLGIPETNELYQEISQNFQQQIQQAQGAMKENEALKKELAKLTGQQIPGSTMQPAMPSGGVPGNNLQ